MYTIEISFQTGNSYNTEKDVENIGYSWHDINDAKTALQYIKEHYQFIQHFDDDNWSPSAMKEVGDNAIVTKPWYYTDPEDYSHSVWKYCILLPDNGNGFTKVSVFWVGYFEKLYYARVVIDDDKESDIEFRP